MQRDIDKVVTWSIENQLTLNIKKTYHMSYGRQNIDCIFIVHQSIIEKTSTVRDLGIIFDTELTFKPHIQSISRRISQMAGAARRFCTDIKSNITINRIFNIYIQPLIDYGSIIWNQNRIVTNMMITSVVKRITRYALNITYLTRDADYICFEKRCQLLNIDLPADRLKKQAAIFGLKMLKNDILTSFNEILENRLNRVARTRRPNIFVNFNDIPNKSPIFIIMDSIKNYQNVIDLQLSISTNRSRIKDFENEHRSNLADTMQSRSRGPSLLSQGNARYHL